MVNKISNETILKIYDLYTCVDYDLFKWKRYKILSLLDNLQQYNSNKYDDNYVRIDIYYDKHQFSNNKYGGAFDDFIDLVVDEVINKDIGHYEYRKKLKFWINKNCIKQL